MGIRAKENHPLHKKMDQLFQLMEELNISISTDSYNTTVTDKSTGEEWYLRDADSGERMTDIPAWCEFKLVKDD